MSKFRLPIIALMAGLLIGAALIHFLYPRIEERTEYKDREVVKTRIITRIKERPDGGKDTEIIEEGSKEKDTKFKQEKIAQKQYLVGLGASTPLDKFDGPEYSVLVGRRIVGPVLGFVQASKENVGVGIIYEF
jgi:hypothetical protein